MKHWTAQEENQDEWEQIQAIGFADDQTIIANSDSPRTPINRTPEIDSEQI